MQNRKRALTVDYKFSLLPDAEDRVAMAFDMLFDEIEQILQEERLRGNGEYGKELATN